MFQQNQQARLEYDPRFFFRLATNEPRNETYKTKIQKETKCFEFYIRKTNFVSQVFLNIRLTEQAGIKEAGKSKSIKYKKLTRSTWY